MNAKKTLAALLATVMTFGMAACGGGETTVETTGAATDPTAAATTAAQVDNAEYTYQDGIAKLGSCWNPHISGYAEDLYFHQFIQSPLYAFVFNDDSHPVEGKESYTGYVVVPEMAASMPVDVTEKVRAEHPEFGIPESATSGFAHTIDLNPDACFEDGTPIKAADWVGSMQRLLDPRYDNFKASSVFESTFRIVGAEEYASQGTKTAITLTKAMQLMDFENIQAVVDANADTTALLHWNNAFGHKYDLDANPWAPGEDVSPDGFTMEGNGDAEETPFTVSEACEFFIKAQLALGKTEEEAKTLIGDQIYISYTFPEGLDFSSVGLYESGEYQITIVLENAMAGFDFLQKVQNGWLVNCELYDASIKEIVNGEHTTYTNTYNTSKETTSSFGPYKLVSYQPDKGCRFERNENWFGYKDGKHTYVDEDGQTCDMYQTTAIETQVVAEPDTQKMMFLKGQLSKYNLQGGDMDTYRNSEYCFNVPQDVLFYMVLNGHITGLQAREASEDFDQSKYDLECMSLTNFHKGIFLSLDREEFVETQMPNLTASYGLLSEAYIYDPDTGAKYRDTPQAMQALCDVYAVDTSKFASLEDAVASITGYDPVGAKACFDKAFEEGIERGYITDADGDGKCDQMIQIEYIAGEMNERLAARLDFFTSKVQACAKGSPFEGKIEFVISGPVGEDWANVLKSGLSDTILCGIGGGTLDPYGMITAYTSETCWDGQWVDYTSVSMTLNLNGEDVTMSLRDWGRVMTGSTVNIDGKDYNFGPGVADNDTRLEILAGIEKNVLLQYSYVPMIQGSELYLLSQQLYYVTDEFNPIIGSKDFRYMRYNYNDAEWADYVASQGGELTY